MNFRFNVSISDKDYFDYNTFWMIRSPYGKKQMRMFRIVLTVLVGVFVFALLFGGGFSIESFIGIIPMAILLLLFQLFLPRFFSWSLKGQMRFLKKSGKMGYSPSSVLEFYEDRFIETTEEKRTEQKYSAVERISIVDNKMIYIHVNNIMSYMLPLSCFESKEQYDCFFDFI